VQQELASLDTLKHSQSDLNSHSEEEKQKNIRSVVKILENLQNYVTSFAMGATIPIKAFQVSPLDFVEGGVGLLRRFG
jgi:hypothetical protein